VQRHGDADGARQLVEVLMLHRSHPTADVHFAVAMALELGCCDAGAIAVLVRQLHTPDVTAERLEALGELDQHGQPVSSDLRAYDRLLGGVVVA
jgi:NADH:ubiquinone oxidoreductase subunit E